MLKHVSFVTPCRVTLPLSFRSVDGHLYMIKLYMQVNSILSLSGDDLMSGPTAHVSLVYKQITLIGNKHGILIYNYSYMRARARNMVAL